MSEKEKYNDIEQLMYRELPPDRYCYIHNYIIDLKTQLQQKENIIKEVRELCEKQFVIYEVNSLGGKIKRYAPISTNKIMEILDKGNK